MVFAVSLASTIGIVATILGLSAVVGAVYAVLRVNVSKTTTELYRQDNDALRARLKTEGEEKVEAQAEAIKLQGIAVEKERDLSVLRDMVTGTSAIDRLADNMAGHFAITETLLRQVVGEDVFKAAMVDRDIARANERAKRAPVPGDDRK